MFIGVVLQKQANAVNAIETSAGVFTGDTIEEAGTSAEQYAETMRKANPTTYRYRTVAGEITHMVNPPASNVTVVPIKK